MSDENAVDDYAADVFDGVADEVQVDSQEISSWDDAENYETPKESNESTEESKETLESSTQDKSDIDPEAESSDPELDEDTSSEESEDSGEDEPEAFELSEQLIEKGLTQSEDGALGKMIKVDGEDTFVSLEDLGNDYSGQQAISKRFNEVNADRSAHQAEVNEVNSYINTFGEKMKEGDSLSAMQYMGEFAGIAPYQVKRQLIEQLMPEFQAMQEMSAADLQSQNTQEENAYLKQSLESRDAEQASKQADTELQSEISTIRETHNIEDSEWDQAITYLQEHEAQLREQDPNLVMDAAFVADIVNDSRAYTRAESALGAASVDLSLESNSELLTHLQEVAYRNPDFDENDLVDLVNSAKQNAVKEKTTASLGNRVNKHGAKPKAKVDNKQQLSPEEDSYLNDIWD